MAERLVDKAVLKTLVPPQSLNHDNFQELAQKAVIEDVAPGRDVFKKGDMDRKTVYLLEGELVDLAHNSCSSSHRLELTSCQQPNIGSPHTTGGLSNATRRGQAVRLPDHR